MLYSFSYYYLKQHHHALFIGSQFHCQYASKINGIFPGSFPRTGDAGVCTANRTSELQQSQILEISMQQSHHIHARLPVSRLVA